MTDLNNTPVSGPEYTSAPCTHFRYTAGDPRIARHGLGVPALDLAGLGYAVVPLERGGKRPGRMLPPAGGVHHATRDPGQIRAWWEQDPLANVGVRTGRLPSGGRQIVVVDLDIKRGLDGPGNFSAFLNGHRLALPPGPVARTPSGGYHLWLGWPPQWGPCPERPALLDGADIKGDGGLVVVPPSHQMTYADGHDGERGGLIPLPYAWESGCPCSVPWAPPWFAHWITTAPAAGRAVSAGSGDGDDMEQVMAHGAPAGQRNNAYYRLACSRYRKHGTGPDGAATVLAEVKAAWLAGDTAGFTWHELLICAESARKFIARQEQAERQARSAWMEWIRS
jgi:hypothetical protein